MLGYSGTPLAKKLGIKDNFRAALLHVPDDVKTELRDALEKCRVQTFSRQISKDLDFIFLFAKSRAGLQLELLPAVKALAPAGMLWISWPKKSSGAATDLTGDVVRQSGLDAGLMDVNGLRGHRRVVGVEVRDPGQESSEKENAESFRIAALNSSVILCVLCVLCGKELKPEPQGTQRITGVHRGNQSCKPNIAT
jgi:hypothetical protein